MTTFNKIIHPKQLLREARLHPHEKIKISLTDTLYVEEIHVKMPITAALDELAFYEQLKKATSDYNANAALNGTTPVDFDDLHTKYLEYIHALDSFIVKS